ncbi:MAG: tetratricopeptide repeat protein [Deltaproteobacteria bacterium]|nr:tetratricopeptide repeat protein [Deltaproteobacteria bacterium]
MRTLLCAVVLLGGCVTPATMGSLEAEVRRLRAEQERHAQQLEMLSNRLVLTEDATRQARTAMEDAGRRGVIRLGAPEAGPEPIRVDATTRGQEEDPAAPEDAGAPRPRITGTERVPERAPFVVHDNERLPVVPLPPAPGAGGPSAPAPAQTPAPAPPARPLRGPRSELQPEAPSGTLDPRALPAYEGALALVREGRCEDALGAFSAFLVRYPDHPHADNAMYWRGECFLQRGETQRAIAEFEGLLARFPAGNKVPDALYKLALSRRRQGDSAGADEAARRLLEEHPDSEPARRMRTERQGP